MLHLFRGHLHACDATLPPPRPGVRHVRVPHVCVVLADDDLRRRVDRYFHWPMIVLALLVLPLLAIELYYLDLAPEHERSWLGVLCWVGFTLIWLAFFVEFVVKIMIAECRIEYLRRNWLDVIILVVPLLRPLRATSVVRTSRVFKLRGVGMKAFRYVFALIVGIEALDPILERIGLKAGRKRKEPEAMTRYELMDEVRRLRRRNDQWEAWYQKHLHWVNQRHVAAGESHPTPPPAPHDLAPAPVPAPAPTSQSGPAGDANLAVQGGEGVSLITATETRSGA